MQVADVEKWFASPHRLMILGGLLLAASPFVYSAFVIRPLVDAAIVDGRPIFRRIAEVIASSPLSIDDALCSPDRLEQFGREGKILRLEVEHYTGGRMLRNVNIFIVLAGASAVIVGGVVGSRQAEREAASLEECVQILRRLEKRIQA